VTDARDSIPVRRGGWIRRSVYAAGLLLLIACLLLATGWPQRLGLEAALGAASGTRVEARGVRLFNRLQVRELRFLDPDEARESPRPVLDVAGLDIDYHLLPSFRRYIDSVSIDTLTVRLDSSNPDNTNYDFFFKQTGQSGTGDVSAYLPGKVQVGDIDWAVATPTFGAACDGLRAMADIASLDRFSVVLRGASLSASWWFSRPENVRRLNDVAADVCLAREGAVFTAEPLRLAWPGLAEIAGRVRVDIQHGLAYDVAFETFRLGAVDLARLGSSVPSLPVRFNKADLSGTHITGDLTQETFAAPPSALQVTIEALTVGEQYRELYEGDLALRALAGPAGVDVDVTLNQGQKVTGIIQGAIEKGAARLAVADWSRDAFFSVIPKGVRHHVTVLSSLERLSAAVGFAWEGRAYEAKGEANPLFRTGGGVTEPVHLTLTARGPLYVTDTTPAEQTVTAQFRDQRVEASARMVPSDGFDAQVHLEGFDPAEWVRSLTGEHRLDKVCARLTGTVTLQPGPETGMHAVNLEVAASPLLFQGLGVPETETITIAGKAVVDLRTYGRAEGETLDIRVGEGVTCQVKDWWVSFDTYALEADVAGRVDLERLAALLSLEGLWGEAEFETAWRNEKGVHTGDVRIRADPLGYGDAIVLYDTPVTVTGVARYDSLARKAWGRGFVTNVGEQTAITCDAWSFDPELGSLDIPFTLRSDLAPLVATGYLDAATGQATGTGHVRRGKDGLDIASDVRVEAPLTTLAGALATLKNLAATATVAYAETLTGSGALTADEAVLGGATVRAVQGEWAIADGVLRTERLEGTLFGGTLRANVEAALLRTGFPVQVRATIASVDLATLTRDVGIESVYVRGKASGQVSVSFDMGGFQELRADFRAPEGLTLDRGTVMNLLQDTGAVAEGTSWARLGEAAKKRLIEKVVGPEEQRPFDRAELTLECAGRGLEGAAQVLLHSEQLNLTLDVPLHPGTLLQALELRQLEKVENFRTEPVDSGE